MNAELDLFLVHGGGAPRAALCTDQCVVGAYLRHQAADFRPGFGEYLAANWALWLAFVRYADRVRQHRPHYSADAILHVLRFESDLAEARSPYKVNNNWAADFGRLYNAAAGVDFFRLRERTVTTGANECAA